jgi:hypothetical protein
LAAVTDHVREAVGLPLGPEGAYFVGVPDDHGESHRPSVLDANRPPADQPGLWCNWEPNDAGDRLGCPEGDHFYLFDDWLGYIIEHFLSRWGCTLNGTVAWQGAQEPDRGVLIVRDNVVDNLGAIVVTDGDESRRLKVFLCHASEDKKRVHALCDRLRDDNVDAWVDDKHILPGSDWEDEIARNLRATDAVIVCLSPSSVKKRGFVQKELRMALSIAEEQPEGDVFIIPVRLAPCDVPDSVRRWQWVDLGKRGTYARLLAALDSRARAISQ